MTKLDAKTYQELAKTFRAYPESIGIMYTLIGLAGETGELLNKIKKVYRDGLTEPTPQHLDGILDECGDILWYVADFLSHVNIEIGQLVPLDVRPVADFNDVLAVAIDAYGFASDVLDNGQFYRFDSDSMREDVLHDSYVNCLLQSVASIALYYQLSLEHLYYANIAKLELNQKHNLIKGSGDDRGKHAEAYRILRLLVQNRNGSADLTEPLLDEAAVLFPK